MTKDELIAELASRTESSKAAADSFLSAFTQLVTESLAKGEDVRLIGFGTFSVATVSARTGRNPKTGEAMEIKGGKRPKFAPGSKLKAAVDA